MPPHEADAAGGALQLADQPLYSRKSGRRQSSATQQTRDVLLQVLREREPDLRTHLDGVAQLARAVGQRLRVSWDELDELTRAAELHDVGKMAVPDAILQRAGPLDDIEWAIMKQHTIVGERMLRAAPALSWVGKMVRSSHEHWDGSGYPDGLAGEEIPLASRIIIVCDAFDAMTTSRRYAPGVGVEEAVAELRRCSGTQFDPRVVEAFCQEIRAPAAPPAGQLAAGSSS